MIYSIINLVLRNEYIYIIFIQNYVLSISTWEIIISCFPFSSSLFVCFFVVFLSCRKCNQYSVSEIWHRLIFLSFLMGFKCYFNMKISMYTFFSSFFLCTLEFAGKWSRSLKHVCFKIQYAHLLCIEHCYLLLLSSSSSSSSS